MWNMTFSKANFLTVWTWQFILADIVVASITTNKLRFHCFVPDFFENVGICCSVLPCDWFSLSGWPQFQWTHCNHIVVNTISRIDCDQCLFFSKIRGKERKTIKRAIVTLTCFAFFPRFSRKRETACSLFPERKE